LYLLSVFLVFTFTAVWHDTSMHLFAWGWLMALAVVPEYFVSSFFARPRFDWLRSKWYYVQLAAIAGSVNVIFLITANLIGFSIGADNVYSALVLMASNTDTLWLFLCNVFWFVCGINIIFEADAQKRYSEYYRKRQKQKQALE
jgi:protein-cysteine N-palmitoyltransferase HHAT